jgi:hypothetical protein
MESLLSDPLVWRLVGLMGFSLYDASSWQWWHYAEWVGVIFAALHIMQHLVLALGSLAGKGTPEAAIPGAESGKLLSFDSLDWFFVTFNKCTTALFSYHMIRYLYSSPLFVWSFPEGTTALAAAGQLAGSVLALYIVYDFGYTLFHWGLHHGSVYRFVHKHHHRQAVPFRGNLDAVNVHPFEFATGEYNHMFAAYAVAAALEYFTGGSVRLHAGAVGFFVIAGGILASLNHTRFAFAIPFGVYQVSVSKDSGARKERIDS